MTRAARARVGKLERILLDRSGHFATAGSCLEGCSVGGAEGFVAVLRQGLPTSVYPDGFLVRPRTVIPAEAAFRYVQAREVIQAEQRKPAEVKPAEIKKLYADLLARVTLRTVAEALDIAPPTLVDEIVFNGDPSPRGEVL